MATSFEPSKVKDELVSHLRLTSPSSRDDVPRELFPNCLNDETELLELFVVQDFPPVEDVRGLHHVCVNALVVQSLQKNVFNRYYKTII